MEPFLRRKRKVLHAKGMEGRGCTMRAKGKGTFEREGAWPKRKAGLVCHDPEMARQRLMLGPTRACKRPKRLTLNERTRCRIEV